MKYIDFHFLSEEARKEQDAILAISFWRDQNFVTWPHTEGSITIVMFSREIQQHLETKEKWGLYILGITICFWEVGYSDSRSYTKLCSIHEYLLAGSPKLPYRLSISSCRTWFCPRDCNGHCTWKVNSVAGSRICWSTTHNSQDKETA